MKRPIRVAILDLYEGQANEGMRCIRDLLRRFGNDNYARMEWDEFEVRINNQLPDLSYDIYISSGGPGSPLDSRGGQWEREYFSWLQQVENYNKSADHALKKYVLLICHSFQITCRYYELAKITKRRSTAFGIFPVTMLEDGLREPVFSGLENPFYAVESRDYQVVQPNEERLQASGAKLLAIEKERPHVPLERAVMAIRFNKYMIGVQFHPEADAEGMTMYLQREDRKRMVIENYGPKKWQSMISSLNDPGKIIWTQAHVIPNFLLMATTQFSYLS